MEGITMSEIYRTISSCRSCGSESLEQILDLGEQCLPAWPKPGDPLPPKAPLVLLKCGECGLVQLKHTVDRDLLYKDYGYRSGVNQSMKDALKDVVDKALKEIHRVYCNDYFLDIGSNDGTLLDFYPTDVVTCGFEPSNIWSNSSGRHLIIHDYFSSTFLPFREKDTRFKIITCIACFYDLNDPNAFLQDVKKVLAPDGVFIIQMNYLGAMIRNNTWDNIGHEHLCYYSLRTLVKLLWRNQLHPYKVEFNDVNGGSFRIYIKHGVYGNNKTEESIRQTLAEEEWLSDSETYRQFAQRIEDCGVRLESFIWNLFSDKKQVYVYGASTRGLTVMRKDGLNSITILNAVERNPDKVGHLYGDTGIPIVNEEWAHQHPPDYYLILPYHFLDEFIQREMKFLLNGGKFIVPIPELYVLSVTKERV